MNAEWDLVIFDSLFNCHSYSLAQLLHRKGVPYVVFGSSFWLGNEAYRLAFGRLISLAEHLAGNRSRTDVVDETDHVRVNTVRHR